jgi:soluble cytochrome b562
MSENEVKAEYKKYRLLLEKIKEAAWEVQNTTEAPLREEYPESYDFSSLDDALDAFRDANDMLDHIQSTLRLCKASLSANLVEGTRWEG